MTKEPSKDFRGRLMDRAREFDLMSYDETADCIISLCKEMLVPEKEGSGGEGFAYEYEGGWNDCRQHLLKQLGENIK